MIEYSYAESVLLVNGVEITGFWEGDDVIQIERLNDSASHIVGVDGTMVFSQSLDRSGSFTFRLVQGTESNRYLTLLMGLQENGESVPIFVQFKDTKGSDLASGTQGYITRPSGMTRGANANAQEWVIVVERLDLLHLGG